MPTYENIFKEKGAYN